MTKGIEKILIIKDSQLCVESLTALISQEGYNVDIQFADKFAIDSLSQLIPDLIILGADGADSEIREIYNQIMSMTDSQDIPLIFLFEQYEAMNCFMKNNVKDTDFILLSLGENKALNKIENILEFRRLKTRVKSLEEQHSLEIKNLITELNQSKNIESSLLRAEANLERIQEIAHIGYWERDYKTNVLKWSDELYRIFGLSPQEKSIDINELFSFIHPDDLEKAKSIIDPPVKISGPYEIDYRIVRKDGALRYIHVHGNRRIDESNKILHAYGIAVDVTERTRYEQALMEQNSRTSFLNHVAQVTIASNTPEEMVDNLLEIIKDVMPCDAFYIDSYDESTNLVSGIKPYDTIDGKLCAVAPQVITPDPDSAFTETILNNRKPLRILRTKEFFEAISMSPFGDKARRSASLLFAPLISRDRVVGVISVQSYDFNAYSDKDESLLLDIAHQAGPAFESIQLYTETKWAEAALRKSESALSSAQRRAKLGSWELDLLTRTGTWSEEMFRLFNFDLANGVPSLIEFLAKLHPDDRHLIEGNDRKAIQTGEVSSVEFRSNPDFGPLRYFSNAAQVIKDSKGNASKIAGTVLDITELKQKEIEMTEQNKRMTLLNKVALVTIESRTLEDMSDRLLQIISEVMSCDAYYVDIFDEATEKTYGVRNYDTINGKLQLTESVECQIDTKGLLYQTVFIKRQPYRILRHEGIKENLNLIAFGDTSRQSLSLLYAPMISRDKVVGIISIQSYTYDAYTDKDMNFMFDIAKNAGPAFESIRLYSESKRVESALRKTHEIYRSTIVQANAVPYELNYHTRQYVFIGEGIEALTGYPASEFHALLWVELRQETIMLGEAAGVPFKEACELMKSGKIKNWRSEVRIKTRDGHTKWLTDSSITLFDESGIITGSLGILQDITERKLAEIESTKLHEQLAQAQKMESIGRLAGGVAHDFNNLLFVILGCSEMIMEELPVDASIHEQLTDIINAGERAKELTRQLLAFSRKQVFKMKQVSLNDVVNNIKKMIFRIIGEDIKMHVIANPDAGMINADISQLEQVILNLCVNARDAMPDGGVLTIETSFINLDERYSDVHKDIQPGLYAMLSVSDTGEGMTEDTKNHLFEPFYTTKEKGKGTGLGLATVFGIIKQHGGSIYVYSELGRGSTFKIFLPQIRTSEKEGDQELEESPIAGSGETILVMEDEKTVRKLACQMLINLGYNVLQATTPEECIKFASEHEKIDLLLSDVIMPGMNGYQIYQKVAAIRPGIKILFMSGYTDEIITHHGVLDKGFNFISKPFTTNALSRKIRESLK